MEANKPVIETLQVSIHCLVRVLATFMVMIIVMNVERFG